MPLNEVNIQNSKELRLFSYFKFSCKQWCKIFNSKSKEHYFWHQTHTTGNLLEIIRQSLCFFSTRSPISAVTFYSRYTKTLLYRSDTRTRNSWLAQSLFMHSAYIDLIASRESRWTPLQRQQQHHGFYLLLQLATVSYYSLLLTFALFVSYNFFVSCYHGIE